MAASPTDVREVIKYHAPQLLFYKIAFVYIVYLSLVMIFPIEKTRFMFSSISITFCHFIRWWYVRQLLWINMIPSGMCSFGIPFLLGVLKEGNSAIRTDGIIKNIRIILEVVKDLRIFQTSSSHLSVLISQTKHGKTVIWWFELHFVLIYWLVLLRKRKKRLKCRLLRVMIVRYHGSSWHGGSTWDCSDWSSNANAIPSIQPQTPTISAKGRIPLVEFAVI